MAIDDVTSKALRKNAGDKAWVDKANSGVQAYEVLSGSATKARNEAEDAEAAKQSEQDRKRKTAVAKTGKEDPGDKIFTDRIDRLRKYTSGDKNALDR